MKIILFIGHHKVGSSALQDYLARNAVALLEQGVLYPAIDPAGVARLRAGGAAEPASLSLPPNLREAHNALAFSMIADQTGSPIPPLHQNLPSTDEMLATIGRQVEMFQPQVVILAAEVFSHFANISGALIARLLAALPKAEIQLTATFRRVDDYLVSWHGQRLRFGQIVRPLPQGAMGHYFKTIHFDYRKMLRGWIQALPPARRVLRPYDAVMAAGGSVQDFMAQSGLPLPVAEQADARVNQGLHRGLIEIASRSNASLEHEDAQDVFRVLLRLGPLLDLPASSQIELYGAEARERLASRFTPIHNWLSALVREPFFADIDELRVLRPHAEHPIACLALEQLRDAHLREFAPAARAFLTGLRLTPNYA